MYPTGRGIELAEYTASHRVEAFSTECGLKMVTPELAMMALCVMGGLGMIISFKHKGLELFFTKGSYKGVPAQYGSRIERMLDRLDASKVAEDMDLPGYKFHALKGDRKGEFAVSVTGNWRITYQFFGEDAMNVNLEDYH